MFVGIFILMSMISVYLLKNNRCPRVCVRLRSEFSQEVRVFQSYTEHNVDILPNPSQNHPTLPKTRKGCLEASPLLNVLKHYTLLDQFLNHFHVF